MVTSIPSSSVYDYPVKTYIHLILTAIKSSNICRGVCLDLVGGGAVQMQGGVGASRVKLRDRWGRGM